MVSVEERILGLEPNEQSQSVHPVCSSVNDHHLRFSVEPYVIDASKLSPKLLPFPGCKKVDLRICESAVHESSSPCGVSDLSLRLWPILSVMSVSDPIPYLPGTGTTLWETFLSIPPYPLEPRWPAFPSAMVNDLEGKVKRRLGVVSIKIP